MATTRKKVKVIGTETYINQQTGELQEMQVIDIEERDANFHKLWLGHILQSIDLIGNQKTRLAFWILDHLDSNNLLPMTQRQIANKSGISYQTVSRTLQSLIDSNFLQRINQGAYRVNPDVLFKGGKNARMNVLLQYRDGTAEENGSNDSAAVIEMQKKSSRDGSYTSSFSALGGVNRSRRSRSADVAGGADPPALYTDT